MMPLSPPKPCKHPGCPEVTRDGYCHKHKQYERAVKRTYQSRKNTDPFYSSTAWKRLRKYYRDRNPLCEVCGKAAAVMVDHVIPIKDGGAPMELANLQALCWKCHNIKTGKERAAA